MSHSTDAFHFHCLIFHLQKDSMLLDPTGADIRNCVSRGKSEVSFLFLLKYVSWSQEYDQRLKKSRQRKTTCVSTKQHFATPTNCITFQKGCIITYHPPYTQDLETGHCHDGLFHRLLNVRSVQHVSSLRSHLQPGT